MVGINPLEVLTVILVAFAGVGTPMLGVPLPPDEGLLSATPEKCLAYFAYAGAGKPEKHSHNQFEQMVAEDEIQGFLAELMRLADEGIRRIPATTDDQRNLARVLPLVGKTFLLQPSIAYVSQVVVPPDEPSAIGGIVLNAGDEFDAVKRAFEALEDIYCRNAPGMPLPELSTVDGIELHRLPAPPQAPPLQWGAKQPYIFLGVGDGEAAAIISRLKARAGTPLWLKNLSADIGIKRPSALMYANVAAIWDLCEPFVQIAAQQRGSREAERVLKAVEVLGLDQLDRLAMMSGLDETACVSKLLIGYASGALTGADSSSINALGRGDFKSIPADVPFAWVTRFDAAAMFRRAMNAIEQVDADLAQQMAGVLSLANMQLGFSVEDDLLKGLGDTWSLYNSSHEGGLLFTGLCATVKVRDRAKVAKVIDQSLKLLKAAATGDRDRPAFSVRTTEVGSKTISYVQVAAPSPVAPAWCLADDTLIVALSPTMVRAHLTRDSGAKTLADVAMIGEKLASRDVMSLSYSNPQVTLGVLYSYAQYLATAGAGAIEQYTDIKVDIAKFPSFMSIMRHLQPTVSLTRATKAGVLFETYSTSSLGGGMGVPAIGFAAGLVLPAVERARAQAREMVRRNEERQRELERQLQDLNK